MALEERAPQPPAGGWSGAIVRRRGWVCAAWLTAGAILLPQARHAGERLRVSADVPGSDSAAVVEALRTRFASPFAHSAMLVVTGVPTPDTPEGREVLQGLVIALKGTPGVSATASYLDLHDEFFLGAAGAQAGTIVVAGLDPASGLVEKLIPGLRAVARDQAERLHARYPAATLRWTGEAVLNFDLRRTSAADSDHAERRALPLTLTLLVLAFGAVAAALLPVLAGFLAIALSVGVAALAALVLPLSSSLRSIAAMLGLGLGIDYALLMVGRFREALRPGATPEEAAQTALRHAGHTIVLSGLAVAISFAALLLVPLGEVRSLALGGLLVVTMSVLLATTLLPGVLAWLGPRVDFGRLRPWRASHERSERRWRAWSGWVARRPLLTLVVAGVPLLALAFQARRLNIEVPRGNWLPASMESAQAIDDLQAMGRSGPLQAMHVVLELPEDVSALSLEGWRATRRLQATLLADPRIARVRGLPDLAGARADDLAYVSLLPARVKRLFVSEEGDAVLLEVVPREDVAAGDVVLFVRQLRAQTAAALSGLSGTRVLVGGLPAFNADYEEALAGCFSKVVALVCVGTFLALLLGFRSLLIPLKALVLNLVSVSAAFGALVLVFQEGHAAVLVGRSEGTGGVFPAIPLIVFAVVFGLSMDYEVFLIARIAEERRAGRDETGALVEGLAHTGGIVTSAAAIMIVVFGAFAWGEFLVIKMLGFALAVAVLLDATLIRLGVGPALLKLAGRWNWWPGRG